jgi:hypothetical protein
MKDNQKSISDNKVHINDLLEPIDKLLATQTLVKSTSEIVAKYAKTQTGERLKKEEMAIDSLWKTMIILKKYESYFEYPDDKTVKALLKLKPTFSDLADRSTYYDVSKLVIEYLSNQISEWSNEFPERRESMESDINILWRTLLVMTSAKACFEGPNDKFIESVTAKATQKSA